MSAILPPFCTMYMFINLCKPKTFAHVQCAAHKPHMCHTQNCQDLTEKVFLITCLMVQVQVRDFHLRTSICQSLQYLFIKHLLKTAFLMSSEHTLSQKWSDSRLKNRACYVWSCCNGILYVWFPHWTRYTACQQKSDRYCRLLFSRERLDFNADIQIIFGTVSIATDQKEHKWVKSLKGTVSREFCFNCDCGGLD